MEQRMQSRKRQPVEPEIGRRRNRDKLTKQSRKKRRRGRLLNIILGNMVLLTIGYTAVSLYYKDRFLPNTVIGEVNVSGKTLDEIQEEGKERLEHYQLIIEERDGLREVIEGKEIGLKPVYDKDLEWILKKQNSFLWAANLRNGETYEQNCMVEYDKKKLKTLIFNLQCMNPEKITKPANACLVWQDEQGLVIVPEIKGNEPVYERLLGEIEMAIHNLQNRISLDELGVYKEAEITAEYPGLLKQKEQWEKYLSVKVTYLFGNRSEVVDGTVIIDWLTENESGEVSIDREKVAEYVKELSKKYNTAYCTKELKTSYGPTVKITQGHYGWLIDQNRETEELMKRIESGESGQREPYYLQTASSHDVPDYGDTYVEMNLTAQHLFYYKNGKMLIESDFVSGDEANGWSTPAGAYELTYKQKNATLKGSNYKTPVTYWMPFNKNIGMHDGYWRSSFGGTIYKKNGSHGCVNLPPAVAKIIFENIEKGTPVLCYHLNGTETNKTTKDTSGGSNRPGGKEKELPTAATVETAPPETAPAETVSTETAILEITPTEMTSEKTSPEETQTGCTQDESGQKENVSVSEGEIIIQPIGEAAPAIVPVGPGITD